MHLFFYMFKSFHCLTRTIIHYEYTRASVILRSNKYDLSRPAVVHINKLFVCSQQSIGTIR